MLAAMSPKGGGGIQWGAAQMWWEGDNYILEIPAYLDHGAAVVLRETLPERLRDQRGIVSVQVASASRTEGGFSSAGTITLELDPPFPSEGTLVNLIKPAVDEATELQQTCDRAAAEYVGRIRRLDSE